MNKLRLATRITSLICLLVATTARADGIPDLPYLFNWANLSDWKDNVGPAIHSKTNRTYKGKPTGPYTDAPRYRNPWTLKIWGITCCKTPEYRYEKFLKRYQVVQAQNQVRLNRLNWDAYDDYMNPQPNSLCGHVGGCDCKGIYQASYTAGKHCCNKAGNCGCLAGGPKGIGGDLFGILGNGKHGCKDQCGSCSECASCETGCESGACESAACGGKSAACGGCGKCDGCLASGEPRGLLNKIKGGGYHKRQCNRYFAPYHQMPPVPYYNEPAYRGGHGLHGHHGQTGGGAYGYPGMNREDATRYIEGFQYYPPYQLIRSPRDFFMFETKYGIGR